MDLAEEHVAGVSRIPTVDNQAVEAHLRSRHQPGVWMGQCKYRSTTLTKRLHWRTSASGNVAFGPLFLLLKKYSLYTGQILSRFYINIAAF